jgi:zinc transporter ZupT
MKQGGSDPSITAGLILVAITITIAMLVIARPFDGESARFLKIWIVGQAYAMIAMVSAVLGVTIIVSSWPF